MGREATREQGAKWNEPGVVAPADAQARLGLSDEEWAKWGESLWQFARPRANGLYGEAQLRWWRRVIDGEDEPMLADMCYTGCNV